MEVLYPLLLVAVHTCISVHLDLSVEYFPLLLLGGVNIDIRFLLISKDSMQTYYQVSSFLAEWDKLFMTFQVLLRKKTSFPLLLL